MPSLLPPIQKHKRLSSNHADQPGLLIGAPVDLSVKKLSTGSRIEYNERRAAHDKAAGTDKGWPGLIHRGPGELNQYPKTIARKNQGITQQRQRNTQNPFSMFRRISPAPTCVVKCSLSSRQKREKSEQEISERSFPVLVISGLQEFNWRHAAKFFLKTFINI